MKPLGEVLVEERLISREQLEAAQARQRETGQPMGKILLDLGLVDERALVEAVARQIGIPYVDLAGHPPSPAALALVPPEVARRHGVVPVEIAEGMLVVAMAEPTNQGALSEIAAITGYAVRPALALRRQILEAVEAEALRRAGGANGNGHASKPEVPAAETARELSMHELLERMMAERASDLHLTVGTPPAVRVRGGLRRLDDYPVLQPPELRRLLYSILTQRQRERLEADFELDFAYSVPNKGRFRVNVYFQRESIGAAFRLIPFEIKTLEQLGVPPQVADFAHLPRGMVLVTGPTGSGKSTTLAAVVDIANRERSDHILTVEDPIEFLHHHKAAIVNQREVGADTKSFANALRSALREDPDIILVGEMRDLETISTAITAAETGHLVFGTLHTQSAPQTIDRVIDVFPPHQQQQVRVQLAGAIQAVVTQQLLPTADGSGRVVACEIMVATPAVRNLVREGKTHMIYSAMQAGARYGMLTMDQALAELVKRRIVAYDVAVERSQNVEDFNRLLGKEA